MYYRFGEFERGIPLRYEVSYIHLSLTYGGTPLGRVFSILELWDLPPYSPDFNPIENDFANIIS